MRSICKALAVCCALVLPGYAAEPARAATAHPKPPAVATGRKATPALSPATAAAIDARLDLVQPGFRPGQVADPTILPAANWFSASAIVATFRLAELYAVAGDADRSLAARFALGHVLRMVGEDRTASAVLEDAVKLADLRRWPNQRMAVGLHDLSRLIAETDAKRSATLARRAGICAKPCPGDAGAALFAGRSPREQPDDKITDDTADYAATRGFFSVSFGDRSEWMLALVEHYAERFVEDRPLTAIELAAEVIAIKTALGDPAGQLSESRMWLAQLLRRAGEYRRAAAVAAEAEAAFAANDPRQAIRAAQLRIMSLSRLGDASAGPQLEALAERYMALNLRTPSEAGGWLLAEDLVALKRYVAADRLLALQLQGVSQLFFAREQRCVTGEIGRARIARRLGRPADADAHYAAALDCAAPGGTFAGATAVEIARYHAERDGTAGADWFPPGSPDPSFLRAREPIDMLRAKMSDLRDLGGVDAAAYIAAGIDDPDAGPPARATYLDAQDLWQLAYTFAVAGRTDRAFDLMKSAAAIAVARSFEAANSTDGGSLQLLKRDRWRYLLFVDIAWAAATGRPPDQMLVPSRY